jgi:hypothetical protein
MFSPPLVMPQPQYVAAGPAAQIVAAVLELDASGGVQITPASLNLINGFLDHILFNILLAARSTKLIAIRPAVSEVLKPRLAKEVVSAADEELREYMGGGVDEELSDFHGGQEPSGHFELERSWKLTRLRCMVYTRLGDMEEEDEEEHLHRDWMTVACARVAFLPTLATSLPLRQSSLPPFSNTWERALWLLPAKQLAIG